MGAQFHKVFLGSGKVEKLRNVKVNMGCDLPLNRFNMQTWHMSEGLRVGLNVHFVPSKIWLNASLNTVITGKFHNSKLRNTNQIDTFHLLRLDRIEIVMFAKNIRY